MRRSRVYGSGDAARGPGKPGPGAARKEAALGAQRSSQQGQQKQGCSCDLVLIPVLALVLGTWGVMVMSEELSVVPAMVWSSQGSMNTTLPSLVLGTIMPTADRDAAGGWEVGDSGAEGGR